MRKLLVAAGIFAALLLLWYSADINDYFKGSYRDLTKEQEAVFRDDTKDSKKIYEAYKAHFGDSAYTFPRHAVTAVKIYRNTAIIGTLSSKTLSNDDTKAFLSFCNSPDNFDWSETTWGFSDAEYIFKLFDEDEKLVGKLHVCLKDCGMVESRPFTPNMKFGALTKSGEKAITRLIGKYL